jgi:hypothetical protein
MTATIHNVSGCACSDLLSVPLQWDGQYNAVGEATFSSAAVPFGTCPGSPKITISIVCTGGAPCAWQLHLTVNPGGGASPSVPNTCTGCPTKDTTQKLSLTYNNLGIGTSCGMPPPANVINLVITEN